MTTEHVLYANSEYTGGGVNTYYGRLSDGQYFVFELGVFMLCDADYAEVFTPKFFKETGGDTYEWEKEHGTAIFFNPKEIPENQKDIVRIAIKETFKKLKKNVDLDFAGYLV